MKLKSTILLFAVILQMSYLNSLENSIVPLVERFENLGDLSTQKYAKKQLQEIQQALLHKHELIRLVSYNILTDEMDGEHGRNFEWKKRFPRIVELLEEMQPDIVAVQELSEKQLNDLLPLLQDTYEFFGYPRQKDQEYNGFFYRKKRFVVQLHEVLTVYESGSMTNTVASLQLKDKITNKHFAVYNTHLPFFDSSRRELEVRTTLEFIKPVVNKMPAIFVGDLNTFPNRLDLDLPFYDGDYIHRLLTAELFEDSLETALLGHFGPMSTYTNDTKDILPFRGQGTPGVILDHIYVSDRIEVLVHAVQPATVDDFYPSDHMPVFIDFLLK